VLVLARLEQYKSKLLLLKFDVYSYKPGEHEHE
jgi:hypothetical protein